MVLKSAFRKHKLLIAAGLFGISAAIANYAAISPFVATAPVVVAARAIGEYERIDARDVRVTELPLKSLPASRFETPEGVVGSYALTRIVEGQIVLRGHVALESEEAGLSVGLAPEMRCVFVPASPERALGGHIREGERVDVVFTPRGGGYGGSGGPAAPSAVRSLRVLRVCVDPSSQTVMGVVLLAGREDAESIAHNIESCAVSLLLTPRDAWGTWGEEEAEVWQPQ